MNDYFNLRFRIAQKSIYVIEKSFVGVFKAKHIYLWQIVTIP